MGIGVNESNKIQFNDLDLRNLAYKSYNVTKLTNFLSEIVFKKIARQIVLVFHKFNVAI